MANDASFAALVDATAGRYQAAGRSHQGFARGKLRYDPVFRALLHAAWWPQTGRLVDVGCGRGLLLALLDTARRRAADGEASPWPVPSAQVALHGVDMMAGAVSAAQKALGDAATFTVGDAARHPLPEASAIVLLDVLHYLHAADQEALLARAAAALVPGGVLVLREADAGPGMAFTMTRWAERIRAVGRGHWRQRFAYREAAAWRSLLAAQGLVVQARPMSQGTPFDNQLVIARRPAP